MTYRSATLSEDEITTLLKDRNAASIAVRWLLDAISSASHPVQPRDAFRRSLRRAHLRHPEDDSSR